MRILKDIIFIRINVLYYQLHDFNNNQAIMENLTKINYVTNTF